MQDLVRGRQTAEMMIKMTIPRGWCAVCCDNRSWHSTHCADTTPFQLLTSVDNTAASNTARVPAADTECFNAMVIDASE